jgi:hypothetical protein
MPGPMKVKDLFVLGTGADIVVKTKSFVHIDILILVSYQLDLPSYIGPQN